MLSSAFLLVSLVPFLSAQSAPHSGFVPTPNFKRDGINSTQNSTTGSMQPLSTISYGASSTSASDYPQPTDMSAPEGIFFIPPDVVQTQSSAAAAPSASSNSSDLQSADVSTVPLVMAYYPDWVGASFPPEDVDFDRYDWIDFAFALPDRDFNVTWDNVEDSPDLLHRLVVAAHSKGKKVKLSVGGWTGSQ